MTQEPWQNIDTILDVLEKGGCCRDGYVNAPEDVVANALREWLQSIQPTAIRAAENDALERAAIRVIEFLSGSTISKPISEVIRHLKHEEVK